MFKRSDLFSFDLCSLLLKPILFVRLIHWLMITFIQHYCPLSRAGSLRSHVIPHEWTAFHSAFLNINRSRVLTALASLVPHETAAVSAQVMCTPYNHAPCHFMQSHIRKVYACFAVTCYLHFWQNDRDLLRATVAAEFSPSPSQFNTLVLFTSVTVLILFQLCWLCLSKSLLILRCLNRCPIV